MFVVAASGQPPVPRTRVVPDSIGLGTPDPHVSDFAIRERRATCVDRVEITRRARGHRQARCPPKRQRSHDVELDASVTHESHGQSMHGVAFRHPIALVFTEQTTRPHVGTALELMDENRTGLEMRTSALSTLSESLRQLGDYTGAVEAARKAVETAQQQPCIADGIRAQTVLGTALIALNGNGGPDPRDEVKACLSSAAEWLEESGALGMEPRIRELEQRLASL